MSELTQSQLEDIKGYFVALKTFFNATNSNKDRSSSSRAQKARAKLLKLSPSQFYELSTDVSDELNRRINEDQDQPEYLLPKTNFHVKRNQARQKLAKLSQTRFNDLIDDILFEIYRRDYHNGSTKKPDGFDNFGNEKQSTKSEMPFDPKDDTVDNYNRVDDNGDNTVNRHSNTDENSSSNNETTTSTTVQPIVVIPKKASIDWSSEEEDNNENLDGITKQVKPITETDDVTSNTKNESTNLSDLIEKTFNNAEAVQEEEEEAHNKMSTRSTDNDDFNLNDTPVTKNSNEEKNNLASKLFEFDQPQDVYSSTNDFSSLYRSAEDISDVKEGDQSLELGNGDDSSNHIEHRYQKDFIQLNSQIRDLSIENEQLKQRISELELEMKSPTKSVKRETYLPPVDTKKTLKNLMEDNLLNDSDNLQKFFDPNGYISFEHVDTVRKNVNLIYSTIYANYKSEQEHFDVQGKTLFKYLAYISDAISRVLSELQLPEFHDQNVIVKAAVSHAITTLRYYTTYGPLIPVVTLQASITEILFSFCTLIKSAKIKYDGKEIARLNSDNTNNMAKSESRKLPTFPSTPVVDEKQKMTPFFQKPGELDSFLDQNEESPVKPLKITQKAINSPKLTPASTSRKPSGTGLFSLKIESKSVDTLSRLKEENNGPDLTPSKISRDVKESGHLEIKTPSKDVTKDIDNNPKTSNPASSVDPNIAGKSIPVVELKNQTDSNKTNDNTFQLQAEPAPISTNKKSEVEPVIDTVQSSRVATEPTSSMNNLKPDPSSTELTEPSIEKPSPPKGLSLMGSFTKSSLRKVDLSGEQNKRDTDISKDQHPIELKKFESTSAKESSLAPKSDSESHSRSSFEGDDSVQYEPLTKSQGTANNSGLKDDIRAGPNTMEGITSHETKNLMAVDSIKKNVDIKKPDEPTKTIEDIKKDNVKKVSSITTADTLNSVIESPQQNTIHTSKNAETKTDSEEEDGNDNEAGDEDEDDDEEDDEDEDDEDEDDEDEDDEDEDDEEDEDEDEDANENASDINFDIDAFDIENPDNTLSELLLYLEHQTMQVISTIQSLLTSIKEPQATKGNLRSESNAINEVIGQMVDATSISMNQSRNANLKEHGSWVVQSLQDCAMRLTVLCKLNKNGTLIHEDNDGDYADKNFKQRLAGIAFDVAKCTKELVKTVEEASLKEEIDYLNARLK